MKLDYKILIYSTQMMLVAVIIVCTLGSASADLTVEQKEECILYEQESAYVCSPGSYRCGGKCCRCEPGTYMKEHNTCPECIKFTECDNGQEVLYSGDPENDRVCGDLIYSSSARPLVHGHSDPPNDLSSLTGVNLPSVHVGHMTTPSPPDMTGPWFGCPSALSWPVFVVVVLSMFITAGILGVCCHVWCYRSHAGSFNGSRMSVRSSDGSRDGLDECDESIALDDLGSNNPQLDLQKELDSVKVT